MVRRGWLPAALVLWLETRTLTLRTRRSNLRIAVPLIDAWPAFEVHALGEYNVPKIGWDGLSCVLDVGAHVGSFALWVAERSECKIVAVEPNPIARKLLARNTAAIRDRVKVVGAAIGGRPGSLTLFGFGEPSTSSLTEVAQRGDKVDVIVITLEQLIDESGFQKIDLLKMDIEGQEQEVFHTITDSVLRRVRQVIVECHPHAGTDVGAIREKLTSSGMMTYSLDRFAPLVVGWRG